MQKLCDKVTVGCEILGEDCFYFPLTSEDPLLEFRKLLHFSRGTFGTPLLTSTIFGHDSPLDLPVPEPTAKFVNFMETVIIMTKRQNIVISQRKNKNGEKRELRSIWPSESEPNSYVYRSHSHGCTPACPTSNSLVSFLLILN